MEPLKIVFMGTPAFAVPMLDVLLNSTHQVLGVITSPDKPAGRGMQLAESAVKKFATEKGLNILQPVKLRDENFLANLKAMNADLFVIVAFRMLPEVVWNMPPLGSINLHASLLPQYRGAAPINWALVNGEKETGVTTFFLRHEIDTGKIIFQEKIAIRDDENAGELADDLMKLGARVLRQTVDAIALGNYPEIAQDHIIETKTAPKIFKENCKIDWNLDVHTVYNFIRGLSPYPTAFTIWQGKGLKLFKAIAINSANTNHTPGSFETDSKTFLRFYCNNGYMDVKECQLEGRKKMGIVEFLRGQQVTK